MTADSPWSVAVVIPARDEESTVAACVASVRIAVEAAGGRGDVVVVADSCADGTVDKGLRLYRRQSHADRDLADLADLVTPT